MRDTDEVKVPLTKRELEVLMLLAAHADDGKLRAINGYLGAADGEIEHNGELLAEIKQKEISNVYNTLTKSYALTL